MTWNFRVKSITSLFVCVKMTQVNLIKSSTIVKKYIYPFKDAAVGPHISKYTRSNILEETVFETEKGNFLNLDSSQMS